MCEDVADAQKQYAYIDDAQKAKLMLGLFRVKHQSEQCKVNYVL